MVFKNSETLANLDGYSNDRPGFAIIQSGISIVLNKAHKSHIELMLSMCDPHLQLAHCETKILKTVNLLLGKTKSMNTFSRLYLGQNMTMALL